MTTPDITIPEEALGAAAHHAAITIYRLVDPDTRAHELTEDELGGVALAAIRAAIEAWPGVIHNGHWLLFPHTKLPLPKEPEA